VRVTLSDRERRLISLFDELTGATAVDCIVHENEDGAETVVFLVAAGEMGRAVGRDGHRVETLEERIGSRVDLVENADTPEAFVESALAPAVVEHVTISEQDDRVAYVEVAPADRGVAIGANGRTIEVALRLAMRHHDIDAVTLT